MNIIDIGFNEKLEKQLQFIVEIDKVKNIFRKSKLFDGNRFENDAEHSWTICIMALLLKEYADFPVNIEKVIYMLLIHDIVEIDTGDILLYERNPNEIQIKEKMAAERIFGLLNGEQKYYFISLWEEFEERESNEAKFACVFDRIEPLIQNYLTEGYTWKKHGIKYDMIIEKILFIKEISEEIWNFMLKLFEKAIEKGYLEK